MSVGYVLFWISAMLVGTGTFREFRARRPERSGWLSVYVMLAIFGAALAVSLPLEIAGHPFGIAVFVFVVGPGIGLARMERAALAGAWTRARHLASTIRLLHPFDGYWRMPSLYRALELDAKNDPAAAALFAKLATDRRWSVRAQVYRLRRQENWEALLEMPSTDLRAVLSDPLPFLARLRALGECGRRSELLAVAEIASMPSGGTLHLLRHPILLYTFAYFGEGTLVQRMLTGPLRSMPPWLRDFWLATAGLYAGGDPERIAREEFAGPRFEAFREGVGALNRRRNALTMVPPTDDEKRRLDAITSTLSSETIAMPELYSGGGFRHMPITASLALILGAVYVAEELAGGSENLKVAISMGALVVQPGYVPEIWRVVAANFLHFGAVHLAMNVAALFALGPFVEKHLGSIRYLLVLAASGVGSMALTAYVFYAGREVVLVGASGAIMGLVGATAAVLLRLRRNDRSGLVAKRLQSVAFILLLQFAFDFLTPKVSLAAHAGGALCGFAAALLVDAIRRK